MVSFKKTRELLTKRFVDEGINENEFVLLHDANTSKNPIFPYENHEKFDFDGLDPAECKAEFRFEKRDLPQLPEVLEIPEVFLCDQRTVCDGMEGLSVVLRQFAYPCRYSDLIPRFGRAVPELSMISSKVVDFIYNEHHHHLTQWNNNILNPRLMEQYTYAIQERGAALENCFGFIDGTVRLISSLNENQRLLYNRHERVHTLKFQSMAIPNGLIAYLYGPVGKSPNDFSIFAFVSPVTDADCGGNSHLAFS